VWRRVRYWLLLLTLCALATCPSALRERRAHQRAAEAQQVLGYLVERVRTVWKERGRFPQTPAGPTPAIGTCCKQGGTCAPAPGAWSDPAWRVLAFSVDDRHRYSYQYELVDGGQVAVVRATGDVDCDGVYGTYEARLVPEHGELTVTWSIAQPYE